MLHQTWMILLPALFYWVYLNLFLQWFSRKWNLTSLLNQFLGCWLTPELLSKLKLQLVTILADSQWSIPHWLAITCAKAPVIAEAVVVVNLVSSMTHSIGIIAVVVVYLVSSSSLFWSCPWSVHKENATAKDRKDPSPNVPDLPEVPAASATNGSATSAASMALTNDESLANRNATNSNDKHVQNQGKSSTGNYPLRF